MRKRRLAVRFVVGLVVAILAVGVAVPFRADLAWRSMNEEVRALRDEVRAMPAERDVLWGGAKPGNARPHWARAAAAASRLQKDHHERLVAMLTATGADLRNHYRDVRDAWQPVLDALRDGAAATFDEGPLPGDDGKAPSMTNLLDSRWAANAAVFESRALRHEGRHLEAVQATLDAAAMAADLLRRGILIDQMIGCATLAIATSEAWPEAALDELDDDALDLLASGLARLDATLPLALDDRVERLFLAWHLQNSAGDATWLPSLGSTWRFGFSTRWMLADAFLRQGAMARRLAERDNAPWAERATLWERESAAALASGNPVLAMCVPNRNAAEGNWRQQLAALRVLRASVEVHRGNAAPSLLDPISGAPLRVSSHENTTTISGDSITAQPATQRIVRR